MTGGKCRLKSRNLDWSVQTHAIECKAGVSVVNKRNGSWVFKMVSLDRNHECNLVYFRYMKSNRIIITMNAMQVVIGDRADLTAS